MSDRDIAAARAAVRAGKLTDESVAVGRLLAALRVDATTRAAIEDRASALVEAVRTRRSEASVLDLFLEEFGLSNEEGVALLCLAEALLRVPDEATVDVLIEDKILAANWDEHVGRSDSAFVNASTWALLLTGRVIALENEAGTSPFDVLSRLTGRLGGGVIRAAMRRAMRILGGEFVLGRTIDEALERGARELGSDAILSFDMLGEAARTRADADRYTASYAHAIQRVGGAAAGRGVYAGSGVSVKLSALHPRFTYAQHRRIDTELLPRLRQLARSARDADIGMSIDAEESDRLELTLDLFEALFRDPGMAGWEGLGLVVQAYGKRALDVCDWIAALARRLGRRIPVRLVKGAYWDSEIKQAQILGLRDFPVFTQKATTDLSYLVCAERLLGARDCLYPQFATHNAHTLCAVLALAGAAEGFEFQRLHGMGALLYATLRDLEAHLPRVRVYAPVGGHGDLLAYLVRRLLENGANSSFVRRLLDERSPARTVVRDPVTIVATQDVRHPRIRAPTDLFAPGRANSVGFDFSDPDAVTALERAVAPWLSARFDATPTFAPTSASPLSSIVNPARHTDEVGRVAYSDGSGVDAAFAAARAAQPAWNARGGAARAHSLRTLADLLERNRARLLALLVREAGKTLPDGHDEIREAVDLCRYYAERGESTFAAPVVLPGPTGETNTLSLEGRGVFVCISPWNFPLSIFLGQVVAALVAGNAVVAKPAEQTPLVAAAAVVLAHEAGIPRDVLALVPGDGAVGARLVAHPAHAGVAFTGGTDTARRINRALADRPGAIAALIAETGGQNAMFVDSTALLEQVTDDVLRSAFGAAGQRCSALRLLCVQDEIAEAALVSIRGAMSELTIGDPCDLATDVGPVIDTDARARLEAHIASCAADGLAVFRVPLPAACDVGTFVAPTLIELDRLERLTEEHFGPILHVIRFAAADLDVHVAAVRDLGYGLTLGIHTRIDRRALDIYRQSIAGNTYVNRSMIGAVVGVQPFGGLGLSGTGPKAGGPHYLLRFAAERTLTINTMARGGNVDLLRE